MADLIDKGLKNLIKALKAPPHARVGILSGKAARKSTGSKSAPNNATIGAAHEYGSPSRGLPQRSFLRVPINDHLDSELEKNPLTARQTFESAAKDGTLLKFLSLLGATAERVVRLGFTNNGYGKWEKLSKQRLDEKTIKSNILVDTTQLRESISNEVVK